ncbi:dual specificity protein phosphatase family protein [Microbacterium sp. P07]|uniref:dual specificity protein phosphatase family protein n=1 Tax=Microbacterium sp. P07 TaxID=3366952 RepID=UPI0037451A4D
MSRLTRLADVCQLTAQLWVGGELRKGDRIFAQRQLEELKGLGIGSIIDTRFEGNDIGWVTEDNPTIDYLHIGVQDAGYRMPDSWFDDGTEYATEEFERGRVVLAHCQAGINRGPTMAFAILLTQGWEVVDALSHITRARPIARIGYAEDAVKWWFGKIDASHEDGHAQIDRVRQWRVDNQLPRRSDRGGFSETR